MKKICILGGDKRQIELYKLLKCEFDVKLFGYEKQQDDKNDIMEYIKTCDVLLLPIPLKTENSIILLNDKSLRLKIESVISILKDDCFVFYGGLNSNVDRYFKKISNSFNLLKNEDFLLKNALLTAEAAIVLTTIDLNISFKDLSICVIGYGRIGKELVRLLHAFNAKVIICTTKKITSHIDEEIFHTSNVVNAINKSDLVFNTAPYMIVKNEDINKVDKKVLIRELASKPYGFDIEFLREAGYNIDVMPSLPGKVLYKSAAKIIYEKIKIMLEKNNGINR